MAALPAGSKGLPPPPALPLLPLGRAVVVDAADDEVAVLILMVEKEVMLDVDESVDVEDDVDSDATVLLSVEELAD